MTLEEKGSRSDVVSDDVMLCKVINKLHPGMIATIYDPDEDDVSRISSNAWVLPNFLMISCLQTELRYD